ncbi:MAG: FeoA family protein [Pyrinomonadaceae bacterium]
MTLDQIGVGLSAIVINLYSADAERRRMLDLGIVPGTRIETVMRSPLGDPIAYRIRGSVVALRHEQAQMIEVQTPTEQTEQETRR